MFQVLIGSEDFAELREGGYYYVDKTDFLEKFLRAPADTTLFTRPRRFGKTLFMSMLSYFFDITKAKVSHKLFDGLAVSANKKLCDQWMNKYPVIFLSLKDVGRTTYADALKKIASLVSDICLEHRYLLESQKIDEYERKKIGTLRAESADINTLTDALLILTRAMRYHHGKPAIVLIDEYDAPVAKAAENGYYREMVDFMRNFLSAGLKTNSDNLQFGILTGCLRITCKSTFSGLNHLDCFDITSGPRYADTFGFTQGEVDRILCDAGLGGKRDIFKAWYDGYRFGDLTEIYCPWSIMSYLDDLQGDADASPQAYWQNTSENALVKRLFAGKYLEMADDMADFMAGGCLVKQLRVNPTYESLDSSPDNIWTLLYMSGYLTRASRERAEAQGVSPNPGGNMLPLVIPNREIRDIFRYEVSTWFSKHVGETRENELLAAFWKADTEGVKKELEAILLEKVSSRDLPRDEAPRENFYHGLLVGYFLVAYPETYSNMEAGTGQYDIRIVDDLGKSKRAAIVEIKRTSDDREDLGVLAERGLGQIEQRRYDARLLADPKVTTLLHWSIAFCKKRCEARALVVRQVPWPHDQQY